MSPRFFTPTDPPSPADKDWLNTCAFHLARLRPDVDMDAHASCAYELWVENKGRSPLEAAEQEVASWEELRAAAIGGLKGEPPVFGCATCGWQGMQLPAEAECPKCGGLIGQVIATRPR